MTLLQKIFSIVRVNSMQKCITVLGLKFYYYTFGSLSETIKSIIMQNKINLDKYIQAKSIVVFIEILPYRMCGGQMSLFTICKYSKEISGENIPVVMTTMPGNITYFHNDWFNNDIDILRWDQVRKIIQNKDNVILHIPEVCLFLPEIEKEFFYSQLKNKDFKVFKTINNIHINILNQNIELMPDNTYINKLKSITNNITQSVAHSRYCTQEVADKWKLPVTLFSGFIEVPKVKKINLAKKERLILFSPDLPPQGARFKEYFIAKLLKKLPTYAVERIFKVKFEDYAKLTAKASFVISFGEGFDGYFNNSALLGTVGFSVYNEDFFPGSEWKNYPNVYADFDEMLEKIIEDIKRLEKNEEEYYTIVRKHETELMKLYSKEKTIEKLKQFYNGIYDYYPIEENSNGN